MFALPIIAEGWRIEQSAIYCAEGSPLKLPGHATIIAKFEVKAD